MQADTPGERSTHQPQVRTTYDAGSSYESMLLIIKNVTIGIYVILGERHIKLYLYPLLLIRICAEYKHGNWRIESVPNETSGFFLFITIIFILVILGKIRTQIFAFIHEH